jgi:YfiR/HmsC-like
LRRSSKNQRRALRGWQSGRGRLGRTVRAGGAFVLAALLWPPCVSGQGTSEYQVKAAFLFNFGKFVEWPQASYASAKSPFSICVLGEDPFGAALDQTLHGKVIANRPVSVLRMKDAASAQHCQIVFVSSSEKSHLATTFASFRGSNALLVGETDGFAASGGAIQFTLEDNHIRFAINPDAIRRAGLQVSSQLLALAKIVRDERSGGKT